MNRWTPLAGVCILYITAGLLGLEWGLYSANRQQFLFPEGSNWDPKQVADLQSEVSGEARGADVDPNPVTPGASPVVLNDSVPETAEIFSRYLLYSAQPDEMITFRALAEMDPANRRFDPKLYQYGGLFIYPVGAWIALAGQVGWIEVGSLADFLSDPREFAKCYIAARSYVVVWGVVGVCLMHALGCRLGDWRSGALAAVIFALMPVVLSLSHEAKPHLPGAVLMLWALLATLDAIEHGRWRDHLTLGAVCGLAVGMVVSSLWIVVLIPLSELLGRGGILRRLARLVVSAALAAAVYALTNPYVIIHYFSNQAILDSNLANSLAMYRPGWSTEAWMTGFNLLVDGSSVFVIVAGILLLPMLLVRDFRRCLVLVIPAAMVFVQFCALAAGKPGEYGRFAIFPNAVLALVAAVGLFRFVARNWHQGLIFSALLVVTVGWKAWPYVHNFYLESEPVNSRYQIAAHLQDAAASGASRRRTIGVLRNPAPYACPPLDFSTWRVVLIQPPDVRDWPAERSDWPERLIVPLNGVEGVDLREILADGYYQLDPLHGGRLPADLSPLTWANKPLVLLTHERHE